MAYKQCKIRDTERLPRQDGMPNRIPGLLLVGRASRCVLARLDGTGDDDAEAKIERLLTRDMTS